MFFAIFPVIFEMAFVGMAADLVGVTTDRQKGGLELG